MGQFVGFLSEKGRSIATKNQAKSLGQIIQIVPTLDTTEGYMNGTPFRVFFLKLRTFHFCSSHGTIM